MPVTAMIARLSQIWASAVQGEGLQLHLFPPPSYLALVTVCWGGAQDPPGLTVRLS